MINSQQHPIERELTSELSSAEAPYRRALDIVRELPADTPAGYEEISACLARLQPVLQQINAMESTLAPLRRHWHALNAVPGAELRSILDVHEQLLRELIERIDRMEQNLSQAKQTLAPAVDAHIRRQRMQRAYGA